MLCIYLRLGCCTHCDSHSTTGVPHTSHHIQAVLGSCDRLLVAYGRRSTRKTVLKHLPPPASKVIRGAGLGASTAAVSGTPVPFPSSVRIVSISSGASSTVEANGYRHTGVLVHRGHGWLASARCGISVRTTYAHSASICLVLAHARREATHHFCCVGSMRLLGTPGGPASAAGGGRIFGSV